MSFRWDSTANEAGLVGHAYSTNLGPGLGQHGSMSRHETRNVLFAKGPDFKQAATVASATGNVDIAPTILRLLGLPGGETMNGRVLHEALRNGPDAVPWRSETHEASRDGYRQQITVSRVDGTIYLDQGAVWYH
jgi:arylsulfatase A-like enzyme